MGNWKTCNLGDICEINMGQSPKSEYYNTNCEGLPFLQGNRTFGIKYPTFDIYTTFLTKIAEAGDIIMSVRAPVGDVNITPMKMCLGRGVCGLRHKDGEQEFLYYLMRYYSQDLINRESGTVFGSINRNDIAALTVTIPPLSEQIKIGQTLRALDDKIVNNSKINHHLEQTAQTLFKAWVADCSDYVTVGDVVDNILDYAPNKSNPIVLVNSGDVHNGHFLHHTLSANENLKGHFKKRFSKGDILYSEIRPRNRHFAFVSFEAEKYVASTRLMVLRNKPDCIFQSILYQHLKSDEVIEQFATMTETRSGTFPQGCFADLASIPIAVNSLDRQREVAAFLDNVLLTIAANDDESTHLATIRDTLLPRLMSGELSVTDLERVK